MPCRSEYMEANAQEKESAKVLNFLAEVGVYGQVPANMLYYGDIKNLSSDTAKLCDWCKHNDVSKQSLELQIWWRDHQLADKLRAEREQERVHEAEIRLQALAKLTAEERKVLGIK